MKEKIQESARLFTLATITAILVLFSMLVYTQTNAKDAFSNANKNEIAEVKPAQAKLLFQKHIPLEAKHRPISEAKWLKELPYSKFVGAYKITKQLFERFLDEN